MELFILAVANIVLTCLVVYQVVAAKKLAEVYIDALLQKSAGIYMPKSAKELHQNYKEEDTNDAVPMEELSDEDFIKAARGNLKEAENG